MDVRCLIIVLKIIILKKYYIFTVFFCEFRRQKCKYFPSAKEDTEFITIDNEIELSKDF